MNAGAIGYRILVGGGLGRTPVIGEEIRSFLPEEDLLTYLDAIIRVYNQFGRRDNKYKGPDQDSDQRRWVLNVCANWWKAEWERTRHSDGKLTQAELDRVKKHFTDPAYRELADEPAELTTARTENACLRPLAGPQRAPA